MINKAKPFLKWAGGKTQLIGQLENHLPIEIRHGQIKKYIEPFIGGGALFFNLVQKFDFSQALINDANTDLITTYKIIQNQVESLIEKLSEMQSNYLKLDEEKRKQYFYSLRAAFNQNNNHNNNLIERAAQIIFLNKTCFNGLYRVNSKGSFNVPFGKYKNPCLCDINNLRSVSALLQKTQIKQGDFMACKEFIDENTFVYFDPPYRPISKTALFNSYSGAFGDSEQIRLANFFRELDKLGAKLMLSNSYTEDGFFEQIYKGFQIKEILASRLINSQAHKRGQIKEVLIMNY